MPLAHYHTRMSVVRASNPYSIQDSNLGPQAQKAEVLKTLNFGTLKKTDLYNHSNMCQRDSNTSWPAKCHVKTECVFFILLLLLSSIKNSTEQNCNNVWNIHFTDCISDIILSWAYIRQGIDRKNATYVRVNIEINKYTWHIIVCPLRFGIQG